MSVGYTDSAIYFSAELGQTSPGGCPMKRETKYIVMVIAGICALPLVLAIGFFALIVGRVVIRMIIQ